MPFDDQIGQKRSFVWRSAVLMGHFNIKELELEWYLIGMNGDRMGFSWGGGVF